MPDLIEAATSGRAKCRGCGRTITKGELRFGEAFANPYAEGEALWWFHLGCAALMRPEKLEPALSARPEVEGCEALLTRARKGIEHRRLPRLARAERAPSGRARCRLCRELIEKGAWRVSLQMFEEGRVNPIGHIHVQCAEAYFGTAAILDRIEHITPDLAPEDVRELSDLLAKQRPAPPRDAPEAAPLAKTHGDERELDTAIAINAPGSSRSS